MSSFDIEARRFPKPSTVYFDKFNASTFSRVAIRRFTSINGFILLSPTSNGLPERGASATLKF